MKTKREDVRNVAIIAHVDHGKTTLVDQLLKQSGVFRENQEVQERVMDSNDIERERGITILSKNTAVHYKGVKINIIDTPGHADFGGEVERVLKMVDGVILLVDAFEGAMPQTKFVLRKALELDLHVIVCINKIDRPEARPEEVIDEVLELLMDLEASDEQLDCPFLYASAKAGHAVLDLADTPENMAPLFETILKYIPAPEGDPDADTQVLISTIDYNEYVGRIGVGKVENGKIAVNQELTLLNHHDLDKRKKVKISKLYEFDGLNKVEVKEASIGSIVAISGIEDIHIGDTLCGGDNPEAIPFQKISEPTLSMNFTAHVLNQYGQMKFTTSGNFEALCRVSIFYTKADIGVQLTVQTVTKMTGSDVFTFLSGERAVIYHEVHGDRRLGDLLERNRLRLFRRTQGITDMDIRDTGDRYDLTDGRVLYFDSL